MTVTDAPQVSQVAPEQTDLVIDKLNAWRDEMPAIDPQCAHGQATAGLRGHA